MTLIEYLLQRPGVSLQIMTVGDSKHVIFTNPIYKNSPFRSPTTWSDEFTNEEIMKDPDLTKWLKNITGLKQITTWTY